MVVGTLILQSEHNPSTCVNEWSRETRLSSKDNRIQRGTEERPPTHSNRLHIYPKLHVVMSKHYTTHIKHVLDFIRPTYDISG